MAAPHLFIQLLILQRKVNLRVWNVESFTRLREHLLDPASLLLLLFSHGYLSLNGRYWGVIGCVVIRVFPLHAFLRLQCISCHGFCWFPMCALDCVRVAKDWLGLVLIVRIRLTIPLIGVIRVQLPFEHLLHCFRIQFHRLTSHRKGTLCSSSVEWATHHHLLVRLRQHLRWKCRRWIIKFALAVCRETLIGIETVPATQKLSFESSITALIVYWEFIIEVARPRRQRHILLHPKVLHILGKTARFLANSLLCLGYDKLL